MLFLIEAKQAGIFQVRNLPPEEQETVLGVVCPNILYPYLREVVSDVAVRAGFAPVLLNPINFESLYLQQKQQGDLAVSSYQSQMLAHDADPTKPGVDLVAMSKDPKLQGDPTIVRDLVAFQRSLDRPDPVPPGVSARNTQLLFARLALPEGDPNKITSMQQINQAYAPADGSPGVINKADRQFLQDQFTNGQTDDGKRVNASVQSFIDTHKDQVLKPFGQPTGTYGENERLYQMTQDLTAKVAAFRAAGKDPSVLFDPTPGNKDYFGSPGNMLKYTKSWTDQMMEESGQPTPPAGPGIISQAWDALFGASKPAGTATAATPAQQAPQSAVPKDLPAGASYYGQTKDGRPVYLLPNGMRVAPGAPTPPASTPPTVPLAP